MEHFPRYWPLMRGIHRSPVNSPHKGQWRGALMFSLIMQRLNKRLSKHSWDWWFDSPSGPLSRHCNDEGRSVIPIEHYPKESILNIDHLFKSKQQHYISSNNNALYTDFYIGHFLRVTHWNRDKICAVLQKTFSDAFSWMKMFEFWLKFNWNVFQRVQ